MNILEAIEKLKLTPVGDIHFLVSDDVRADGRYYYNVPRVYRLSVDEDLCDELNLFDHDDYSGGALLDLVALVGNWNVFNKEELREYLKNRGCLKDENEGEETT